MALAAAACAFIDVPWPREEGFTATEALERLEDVEVYTDLRDLVHDVFINEVVPHVRLQSSLAQMYADAQPVVGKGFTFDLIARP
jgi:hypothetical protein